MSTQCISELEHTDWCDVLESALADWWLAHSETTNGSTVDDVVLYCHFDEETSYA